MFARSNTPLARHLFRKTTTSIDAGCTDVAAAARRHIVGGLLLRAPLHEEGHDEGGAGGGASIAATKTNIVFSSTFPLAASAPSSGLNAASYRCRRGVSSYATVDLGASASTIPTTNMLAIGASAPGGRFNSASSSQLIGHPASIKPLNLSSPQRRNMAIRRSKRALGGGNRRARSKEKSEPEPLRNEHLVASLLRKRKGGGGSQQPGAGGADALEVRLVVDQGKGNPSEISVVTLSVAIQRASELGVDLMEVTLDQDTPVIRAVDHQKFMYESKKRGESKTGGKGGGDKPTKEYKFRAGIADHDLQRKADGMIGYLAKGHPIRVTLMSGMKYLRADENAIVTTLDRLREIVGDRADEVKAMKENNKKNHGSLLLHPNKNSAKEE